MVAPALGVTKRAMVYLPEGYDDGRPRFVVYLLHGLGGNEEDWLERGALKETADALGLDAVVVMPDGDDSFYLDGVTRGDHAACLRSPPPFDPTEPPATYCVPTPRYATYLARDLVRVVDDRFRTERSAAGRALVGLSMGGFGAMQLAMRHRATFGAAASLSGLLSLRYAGPAAGTALLASTPAELRYPQRLRTHLLGLLGPELKDWKAFDPAELATSLAPGELRLYFDCGTDDALELADHSRHLHAVLLSRGVAHEHHLVDGAGHTWELWRQRLAPALRAVVPARAFHAMQGRAR